MIDFNKYGIDYDQSLDYEIKTNDLIVIGNIDRNIVETKVLEDNGNEITIKGKYNIENKNAVIGGEIIKVKTTSIVEETTICTVDRALNGTLQQNWKGYTFRTVVVLDEKNEDIDVIDWSFEDTIGSVGGNLFPCELGSGNLDMKTDLSLWSSQSINQKYRVRVTKTVVYIFKGIDDKRFLKFSTVVSKLGINTRGKNDPNKVKLTLKSKLGFWYNKDLAINTQFKVTTPKQFFKLIFDLNDDEVYYANGVDENSFLKINNLHTKEYTKMSELLKAYCSNGVRFCFDSYERIKIFSDFKVDKIESQKTIYEDLTIATLTEDETMIYNTINTKAIQRQTMYNFEDLENKYVLFSRKLENAVSSANILSRQENGDISPNTLTITNKDIYTASQIGDLVCLKRTVEPNLEFYAQVLDIQNNDKVLITPILYDKDFKLFPYGKDKYLYSLLNENACPMDLYYARQELPIVFKFTRNKGGTEKDSSLMYPLLPRVNGETLYENEINIKDFGCASNLKVGTYTGIVEEIDKIYGVWDSSKLLYNREIEQFSNTIYPPIFALSNKVNERITPSGARLINYTHFDNSDLLVEIKRPRDNKNDATMILSNTKTVNKDIDLYVDTEMSRRGNLILQVKDIDPYKLGDVLIANRPEDLSPQEETEFDEVISSLKWVIVGKESSERNHYILLDSPFAKRKSKEKKYSFTRFPNNSIVYLQELYFRGNPVIEFSQDVTGVAKGVNYDGDRSTDIYGEKKYEFDSKQLNKEDMKKMMGYVLDHFQAVDLNSTKFNAPITTFNGIDIELLDVVTILDPKYTKIDNRSKWVVVSILNKAKTNSTQLKLLNINNSNTKPFKLDVKDVLEYKPVEIPTYNHNGNEGADKENNDGSGGEGEDKTLGTFNMAEVDPKLFRARVEKAEGNYIYFKDFAGTEWETYVGKLFPESEFGVSIEGETFLVHSDKNYRAFIKKRDIYNTKNEIIISPELDVKFLIMTSFTDIDGQFYSRRCMIGDGDTYFKFHPITGAKFVGDFVIGENNRNPNNDLWVAMQNTKTYRTNIKPTLDSHPHLKNGDMWIDFSDRNHPWVWNDGAWVDAQDKVYEIKGGNKVYYTGVKPNIDETNKDGDMWFDTSNNNKMYILLNGQWTLADDALDKINTGRIVLNGNTTVTGDFTVNGKNINLTGDTTISGLMQVYGGNKGFILYNGTSERDSTRRLVMTGDGIRFEEWV